MTPKNAIAFLGPAGTFAHFVAQRRFGTRRRLVPRPTVKRVIDYVRQDRSRLGVVPIENSSGGAIVDTVAELVDPASNLFIREALSVNVKLALLGRDRKNVRVIYSHFAPLQHCETWLNDHFPAAELREEASTAVAMQKAAAEPGAAAIGNRLAAGIYKLRVLEYPIRSDVRNVTQFVVVGHPDKTPPDSSRTSIVVTLPNTSGSLCDFLTPFKTEGVNLSRIISRPIVGRPASYLFVIDIEGTENQPRVHRALQAGRAVSSSVKLIGVYPVRPAYDS
ncbi:MAG: prephenate dehydratase [Verrucomicrobia bacterium]|nr:prephenate dehydratase [Verrucomicrobiota bacterium]